jgi:hypothetical protein
VCRLTHLQRLSAQHGSQKQSIRLEGKTRLRQSTLPHHITSQRNKLGGGCKLHVGMPATTTVALPTMREHTQMLQRASMI